MITTPRKTKLYRKKFWARIYPDGNCVLWEIYPPPTFSPGTCRIARVEVRELPKAAGRGKGK